MNKYRVTLTAEEQTELERLVSVGSPLKVLKNLLYNKAILNHLEVFPCLAKSWSGLSRTDLSR